MPKPPREPVRTCIACRQESGKQALVRVVRQSDGAAAIDRTGRAPGRGAYLHPVPDCIAPARKRRALERALRATTAPELWAELILETSSA